MKIDHLAVLPQFHDASSRSSLILEEHQVENLFDEETLLQKLRDEDFFDSFVQETFTKLILEGKDPYGQVDPTDLLQTKKGLQIFKTALKVVGVSSSSAKSLAGVLQGAGSFVLGWEEGAILTSDNELHLKTLSDISGGLSSVANLLDVISKKMVLASVEKELKENKKLTKEEKYELKIWIEEQKIVLQKESEDVGIKGIKAFNTTGKAILKMIERFGNLSEGGKIALKATTEAGYVLTLFVSSYQFHHDRKGAKRYKEWRGTLEEKLGVEKPTYTPREESQFSLAMVRLLRSIDSRNSTEEQIANVFQEQLELNLDAFNQARHAQNKLPFSRNNLERDPTLREDLFDAWREVQNPEKHHRQHDDFQTDLNYLKEFARMRHSPRKIRSEILKKLNFDVKAYNRRRKKEGLNPLSEEEILTDSSVKKDLFSSWQSANYDPVAAHGVQTHLKKMQERENQLLQDSQEEFNEKWIQLLVKIENNPNLPIQDIMTTELSLSLSEINEIRLSKGLDEIDNIDDLNQEGTKEWIHSLYMRKQQALSTHVKAGLKTAALEKHSAEKRFVKFKNLASGAKVAIAILALTASVVGALLFPPAALALIPTICTISGIGISAIGFGFYKYNKPLSSIYKYKHPHLKVADIWRSVANKVNEKRIDRKEKPLKERAVKYNFVMKQLDGLINQVQRNKVARELNLETIEPINNGVVRLFGVNPDSDYLLSELKQIKKTLEAKNKQLEKIENQSVEPLKAKVQRRNEKREIYKDDLKTKEWADYQNISRVRRKKGRSWQKSIIESVRIKRNLKRAEKELHLTQENLRMLAGGSADEFKVAFEKAAQAERKFQKLAEMQNRRQLDTTEYENLLAHFPLEIANLYQNGALDEETLSFLSEEMGVTLKSNAKQEEVTTALVIGLRDFFLQSESDIKKMLQSRERQAAAEEKVLELQRKEQADRGPGGDIAAAA